MREKIEADRERERERRKTNGRNSFFEGGGKIVHC